MGLLTTDTAKEILNFNGLIGIPLEIKNNSKGDIIITYENAQGEFSGAFDKNTHRKLPEVAV